MSKKRKQPKQGQRGKKTLPETKERKTIGYRAVQPITATRTPARNAPCPCGSGRKFKKCCAENDRPTPQATRTPYQTLASQYTPEQEEAKEAFILQWGFVPNPSQLAVFMDEDPEEIEQMIMQGIRRLAVTNKVIHDRFIHGVRTCHRLVTPLNQDKLDDAIKREWAEALDNFDQQVDVQPAVVAGSDTGEPVAE